MISRLRSQHLQETQTSSVVATVEWRNSGQKVFSSLIQCRGILFFGLLTQFSMEFSEVWSHMMRKRIPTRRYQSAITNPKDDDSSSIYAENQNMNRFSEFFFEFYTSIGSNSGSYNSQPNFITCISVSSTSNCIININQISNQRD